MTKLNTAVGFPVTLIPRSCARCGNTFRASGREYTCHSCRKPKARVHKPVTRNLSFREEQIVTLVQQAKANKEIAYELCLTEGTVKEYLHHIFRKLNVSSRTELAVRRYHEHFMQNQSAQPAISLGSQG